MAKEIAKYICQECGYESPKWSGQCANCNEWNSLVETAVSTKKSGGFGQKGSKSAAKPLKLSEVEAGSGAERRVLTGMGEFDRVLGGGMVTGGVILIAGEPGIGKSTLLTQLALSVGDPTTAGRDARARRASFDKTQDRQDDKADLKSVSALSNKKVLYVCGEESPHQVKLRVDRLKVKQENKNSILLLPELDTDAVGATISSTQGLGLVVIDSIQTMKTEDLRGMAGSVGQIRESAFRLIEVAKRKRIPIFLVGHVTKQGSIAGPKVLEHMVDVVLALEGDRQHDFRILRSLKNRFGATDEVGVFALTEKGMEEVKNPSGAFLEESQKNSPGRAVVATVAGLRPILVEIQALVVSSKLASPRRVSTGIDQRKLMLMAAVLQKHCNLRLSNSDIFVNVVGGLKLEEPAADLGLALAIASGFSNKLISDKTVVFGEVGLLGEIRRVRRAKQRIAEAKRLGYSKVISAEEYGRLAEVVRKVLR